MSSIVSHKAFQNTQTGHVWVSKFENDTPVTFVLSEDAEASLQTLFTKVRDKAPGILRKTKNPDVVSLNTCCDEDDITFLDDARIIDGAIRLSNYQ